MTLTPEAAVQRAIAAGRPLDEQQGRHMAAHKAFAAWCGANDLIALPATEETLLMYLFSRRAEWSAHTIGQYLRWLARAQVEFGFDDPRTARSRTFMSRMSATRSTPPQPKTDALTLEECRQAVSAYRERHLNASHHIVRGAYVIAWHRARHARATGSSLARPVSAVLTLRREHIDVSPDAIRINAPDWPRLLIDVSDDPYGHALIVRALDASDGDEPFVTDPGNRSQEAMTHRSCLIRLDLLDGTTSGDWQTRVTEASREERDWRLLALQPQFHTIATDLCEFLVAVTTTRRSADMARITLADVATTPTGMTVTIGPEEKGSLISLRRGGPPRQRTYTLHHVSDTDAQGALPRCSVLCPACALDLLVRWRIRRGAGPEDPLLVSKYGKKQSVQKSWSAMHRIWMSYLETTNDPAASGKRIGSRTFRVTGATLAARSGMTLDAIADLMMCSLENVPRYTRYFPYPAVDPLPLRRDGT